LIEIALVGEMFALMLGVLPVDANVVGHVVLIDLVKGHLAAAEIEQQAASTVLGQLLIAAQLPAGDEAGAERDLGAVAGGAIALARADGFRRSQVGLVRIQRRSTDSTALSRSLNHAPLGRPQLA
jgi:hypothetical protein